MLSQFNQMWADYKKKNKVNSDIMLDEVRFDAAHGVEASFDLMEMLDGKYILHVTKKIHLYSGDYVKFLLNHEFTHLSDFIAYPYEKPALYYFNERQALEDRTNTAADRDIFGEYGQIRLPKPKKVTESGLLKDDIGKMLFNYMNTYSEFHACQTAIKAVLGHPLPGTAVDVDKNQIPAPFRAISIKRMLADYLRKAHLAYQKFGTMLVPQVFIMYFRQVMYLFGYISFFGNDTRTLKQTFEVLGVSDKEELYLAMYQALKSRDIDAILTYTEKIYQDSYLPFVKEYIRRHYDSSLYTEEELDEITPDNYHDYVETLTNRKGGRLWSGRVSPVYGVNDVKKAYGGMEVEEMMEILKKNRLPNQ
ncbi:MAG: hypothetical protein IJ137_09265 [Eubacterium sp.]|nr:hypothetical protein [Eubacterium sp.]